MPTSTICRNWQEFTEALGDWKTMEVWLKELERLRDPDAQRELLPHQKHLILGISGEIRNRIVRFRSTQDTEEAYFPRIESARDSLGNIWTPGSRAIVSTGMRLRPGDVIEFVVTASDPLDEPLKYELSFGPLEVAALQDVGTFSLRIEQKHIGNNFYVYLRVISSREFHASPGYDDSVTFLYQVLPGGRTK